jgi:hypothetical protein
MSNEHELTIGTGTGQAAMGMYKVAIVDGKTKKVKWEQKEWRHNLILNSGMLMVASRTWADCCRACYAGVGSGQQTYDSGTDVASSDGAGNLTSVGATINFTTFANGDCILMDDGTQAYITARPGANAATITPDAGIASQQFTVLKTTLTGLFGNVKRYSAYLPNSPHCVTTRNGNVVAMRRTFDFADETGGVVITEIGLSENTTFGSATMWGSSAGLTLFSHIVLPVALSLSSGDSLRVIYQLQVTILPWPSTYSVNTPSIPAPWPVLPSTTLQGTGGLVNLGISGVAASGATTAALDSYANEPSAIYGTSYTGMPWDQYYTMWVDKTRKGFAWSWPAYGIARTGYERALKSQGAVANTTYVGLTYQHDKVCVWGVAEANNDTWGGIAAIGFGYFRSSLYGSYDPTVHCGYYFEFDEDQTKTNIQKLTLRITYSWSRTLTVD